MPQERGNAESSMAVQHACTLDAAAIRHIFVKVLKYYPCINQDTCKELHASPEPCSATPDQNHCAVLLKGQPIAASVVEFGGGPFAWVDRTFTAARGKGAFCNGNPISVSSIDNVTRSLLVSLSVELCR